MALARGRGLLGRRRVTWLLAIVLGAGIGFAVGGVPDPRTFSLIDERVPVTVAPGALQPITVGTTTTVPSLDSLTGGGADAETEADTATGTNPLAEVRVALAQATEVPGVAGRYADGLEQFGYASIEETTTAPVDVSRVYYADGHDAEAQVLALDLGIVEQVEPMANAPELTPAVETDLLVVIGRDLQ